MEVKEITVVEQSEKKYFKCADFARFVTGEYISAVRDFMQINFGIQDDDLTVLRARNSALFANINTLLEAYKNELINKKYQAKTEEFLKHLGLNTTKPKKFKKPSLQEVAEYAKSINANIDAERFCAYYESNGWCVGKTPMKDWKSAVVTWKRNAMERAKQTPDIVKTLQATNADFEKEKKLREQAESRGRAESLRAEALDQKNKELIADFNKVDAKIDNVIKIISECLEREKMRVNAEIRASKFAKYNFIALIVWLLAMVGIYYFK